MFSHHRCYEKNEQDRQNVGRNFHNRVCSGIGGDMAIMVGFSVWLLLVYGLLAWMSAATRKGDGAFDKRPDSTTKCEDSGDQHSEHKSAP